MFSCKAIFTKQNTYINKHKKVISKHAIFLVLLIEWEDYL